MIFPKSWSVFGFARIVMYVKSTMSFQALDELEDDTVQSIWIKCGSKNSKKILFCHAYREHTSSLGSSIRDQKVYLEKFLRQWEKAAEIRTGNENPEVHICGDINLDYLNGNWMNQSYYLSALTQMVQEACNLGNFEQLVKVPTRF